MIKTDPQLEVDTNHIVVHLKRISTAATTDNMPTTVEGTTIPRVANTSGFIDIEVTEPILLSPFIFGSPENKQGFMV